MKEDKDRKKRKKEEHNKGKEKNSMLSTKQKLSNSKFDNSKINLMNKGAISKSTINITKK